MRAILKAAGLVEVRFISSNWIYLVLFFGNPVITFVNCYSMGSEAVQWAVFNCFAWGGGMWIVFSISVWFDRYRGVMNLILESGHSLQSWSFCKAFWYASAAVVSQLIGVGLLEILTSGSVGGGVVFIVIVLLTQTVAMFTFGQILVLSVMINPYMVFASLFAYTYTLLGTEVLVTSAYSNIFGFIILCLVVSILSSCVIGICSRKFAIPVISGNGVSDQLIRQH